MKGRNHPRNDVTINPSQNESIRDVADRLVASRRHFLKSSLSAAALASMGGVTLGGFMKTVEAAPIPPGVGFAGIGFESIPPNLLNPVTGLLEKDLVSVPAGYTARILSAWGDPIMPGAPDWNVSATQTAADQEKQVGMHHDGMHFFPFPTRGAGRTAGLSSERGLLCVNHEYTDENQLHPDGLSGGLGVNIDKVRKSQAAHGISVQEILKTGQGWRVQRASPFGRRLTANTPMRLSGPAAGHPLLQAKKFDITPTASVDTGMMTDGLTTNGTLNNCAHGYTPWGTYLTCEENFNGYFGGDVNAISAATFPNRTALISNLRRYGFSTNGFGYRWHEVDPRFNQSTNPLETNNHGWVVEVDPFDPKSVPVKRTALGRIKHESAQFVADSQNRVAFYQGDDQVNEYIYKFVCTRPFTPNNRAANRDMLDDGILYVAKFNADGTGTWIPLIHGQNGLTAANGFADQGEVLVKTRQAGDRVGATMMDRPEWCAARPRTLGFQEIEVYCALTNNSRRGRLPTSVNPVDGTSTGSANPPVDAANPRPENLYGQIIRWRETGQSVAALTFTWDLFVEAGDKQTTRVINAANFNPATATNPAPAAGDQYRGNINGDDYSSPDGLWFDDFGRLWIQTDHSGDGAGTMVNFGSNTMSCANPNTGETRRFLTAPTDCEVTGVIVTPDHKTMFVNIQHPGDRGTPANPTLGSNWPHTQGYGPSGRPRSSTVVITRDDGGVIGA